MTEENPTYVTTSKELLDLIPESRRRAENDVDLEPRYDEHRNLTIRTDKDPTACHAYFVNDLLALIESFKIDEHPNGAALHDEMQTLVATLNRQKSPSPLGPVVATTEVFTRAIHEIATKAAKEQLSQQQQQALIDQLNDAISKEVKRQIAKQRNKPGVLRIQKPNGQRVKLEGQHRMFGELLHAVSLRQNTLLVGPTGSGKTHAAIECARQLGIPDENIIIQMPMSDRHEISGFINAAGHYVKSWVYTFCKTPNSMLVLDEMEKNFPKVFSSMNAMLSNGWVTFPTERLKVPESNVIIATSNTFGDSPDVEYTAASKQDASVLNRFPRIIEWDYDELLEQKIAASRGGDVDAVLRCQALRKALITRRNKLQWSPRDTFMVAEFVASGRSIDEALSQSRLSRLAKEVRHEILKEVMA